MSGFKKTTVLLMVIALMSALALSPANAAGYVTIADIKQEIKDGWHETYTYNGDEIRIDIAIEIPDVDEVPILRAKWPNNFSPKGIPDTADAILYEKEGFSYHVESSPNSFTGGNVAGASISSIQVGTQAENSPLSWDEAIDFSNKLLKYYAEQVGSFDLTISSVSATSRMYELINATRTGMELDFSKPINNLGCYSIVYYQVFHGIPLITTGIPFKGLTEAEAFDGICPIGEISVLVATPDDYSIGFHPCVEDGVLAEDIPFASFSKVKFEIEKLISLGYIRDVYSIRLGYVRFNNSADLKNTVILLPVWIVDGIIVNSPTDATPSLSEEEKERYRLVGYKQVLINAQTAKYYDANDKSKTRTHATYITWDEVQ